MMVNNKLERIWKEARSRKQKLTAVGIRCADRATLYPLKLALTSPTSGGRAVGIVRLRTKATELLVIMEGRKCGLL
jgi:hypothetical protein